MEQQQSSDNNLVSTIVVSLDGEWLLAIDPKNIGRDEQWYTGPVPEAKPAKVPWIIQETFPGHRGLAWYWRDFEAPVNPHDQGRYLLRFWTVSYKADVWVNGIHVGGHEGGEDAFVFDVTDAIKSNTCNRIAVRVLNPTDEPIDGIIRSEVPQMGYEGGILDSVELLVVPAVQVEDLFVIPDSKMGDISIQANVRNTLKEPAKVNIVLTVAPAMSGETLDVTSVEEELKPGDTLINTKLKVKSPKLWDLNAPTLYRVTARAYIAGLNSFDEQSTRCGYRDFRFENGYFRLNGRRILLKGALHMPVSPISGRVPYDPDFPRRDLLQLKVMGFNMVRFIAGIPRRCQLDLADEIGLMVYEESFASWLWEDSPKMPARFNNSTVGMIKRDRNHPSIVMWGLLNENFNGELLRHAVKSLPLVRSLDETRVVILNSGRHDHQLEIGSISNPGSMVWEDILDEGHPYRGVPHSAEVISFLRTVGDRAYFIAEVVLWGKDVELEKWLKEKGIRTRAFNSDVEVGRELILVSHKPAEPDGREAFKDLVRRIGRGSTVVFLSPEVFNKSADWYQHPDQPLGWLPLANKGTLANLGHAVYPKDDWAKNLYSF